MNSNVRAFVENFKKKKIPRLTVKDFMKSKNHEMWRKCPNCGSYEDLRKNFYCTECGTQLDSNFK